MVTTRRGWWPAFGPALLAFTVVVCGSVSLLAISRTSVFDGSHPCATTGTPRWAAPAAGRDSLGSGGGNDSDEIVDAFVAAPIVLTADDGAGRMLLPSEFDAVSALGSARLAPRGPPRPTHTTYTQDDLTRDQDTDVIVDDDDDDDDDYDDDDDGRDGSGATDLGSCAHAVIRGASSILILSEFDALFSFAPDNHSLRAPPR